MQLELQKHRFQQRIEACGARSLLRRAWMHFWWVPLHHHRCEASSMRTIIVSDLLQSIPLHASEGIEQARHGRLQGGRALAFACDRLCRRMLTYWQVSLLRSKVCGGCHCPSQTPMCKLAAY